MAPDEVHVWRIPLRRDPEAHDGLRALLDPDELRRADRFVVPDDRHRFAVGRGMLRTVLGRYEGIEPDRVEFRYGTWGKPSLASGSPLRFNLAHSGDLAVLAVAWGRELGVDLEKFRPMRDASAIAARFFTEAEAAQLAEVPEDRKLDAFFAGWTRKEAYLKAIGDGLAMPLDRFEVTLKPGEPARLVKVDGRPGEVDRWVMREFLPAPGYVGAIAVEGSGWRLEDREI